MKKRNDITDWLIHFTKAIDQSDVVDVVLEYEEEDGEISKYLDPSNQLSSNVEGYSAFEILKKIALECGIRYGYSFRKGKTTLYGGEPVICMTEMPLNSFLKYAKTRNKKSIDTYGIAITKVAAYKFGARPVIYGLSQSNFSYIENTYVKRIIPPTVLPISEQYRLVSHNLDKFKIDWSHEREWRIKKKSLECNITTIELNNELEEIEVLNIFREDSYCEMIVFIVQTSSEAVELYDIVLSLKDAGSNDFSNEFLPNKISILIVDKIKDEDLDAIKIENISKDCYLEVKLKKLSKSEKNYLSLIVKNCLGEVSLKAESDFRTETFFKLNKDGYYNDACGYSFIMCNSPRNKYLRELISQGIALPYGEGYIISLIGRVHKFQGVTYHEYIAKAVCQYLNDNLDNVFYTKTTLD